MQDHFLVVKLVRVFSEQGRQLWIQLYLAGLGATLAFALVSCLDCKGNVSRLENEISERFRVICYGTECSVARVFKRHEVLNAVYVVE